MNKMLVSLTFVQMAAEAVPQSYLIECVKSSEYELMDNVCGVPSVPLLAVNVEIRAIGSKVTVADAVILE